MVPTFLLITVLVFILINLAPGRPGGAGGGQGSEDAQASANAREGYRLFKEQYNLDKPIVLNFRFMLERADVEEELIVIARNMSSGLIGENEALQVGETAAATITNLLNVEHFRIQNALAQPGLSAEESEALRDELQLVGFQRVDPIRPQRPRQGRLKDAEDRVEDWGAEIVPYLLEIAEDYVYVVPADHDDLWMDGVAMSASEIGATDLFGPINVDGVDYIIHPTLTRKVRFLAVQRLTVNAKRPVVIRDGERGSEEEEAQNRAVVAENNRIAEWLYPLTASDEEIATTTALWTDWFAENRGRFERTTAQTVAMVFLDTRFAKYWGNLARFDLGTSIRYRRPVVEVIGQHWQYSIYLSLASLFFAYFISIPLGILAAVKQNQFADRGIGILLFIMYSLPSFFVASLLQTNLTAASEFTALQWFPVDGFQGVESTEATTLGLLLDIAWHMVLPVACLTYGSLAVLSRYARTGLLDVIRSDYIRTARAKGLSEWMVIVKHAVRNGMIPILTLLGTTLPVLIGGSIIIEFIFTIDGMGKLMITAIQFRDYNIIMGILLISSILTLLGILLSDISYALVDPRISFD